jgi:hypothetical protein
MNEESEYGNSKYLGSRQFPLNLHAELWITATKSIKYKSSLLKVAPVANLVFCSEFKIKGKVVRNVEMPIVIIGAKYFSYTRDFKK